MSRGNRRFLLTNLQAQILGVTPGTIANLAVDDILKDRNSIVNLLKEQLHKAQHCMKSQADKKRTERVFQVGDWIYLRLQPYQHKTLAARKKLKFSPRFFGLFQVLQKMGSVPYKLDLPPAAHLHPVFHVSCLKPKLGQHMIPIPTLPPVDAQGEIQLEPELVVENCTTQDRGRPVTELRIHWKGTSPEEDTWEKAWKLRAQFCTLWARCFGREALLWVYAAREIILVFGYYR
jgi:hypothetical protein